MTELVIAGAEKNGFSVTNVRSTPLITWLYFLNFATIAALCLLVLRICKILRVLYKWVFPFTHMPKCPVILVLGPKNDTIQEIVHRLSRIFDSEITFCQNFSTSDVHKPRKNFMKSQIIYSQIPIGDREKILQLKAHIRKTFGFVDILVISQNEDLRGKSSTHDFLNNLNKQLLAQFWTVMAFLPEMLRKNRGLILSIALGRTSLVNTGNQINIVSLTVGSVVNVENRGKMYNRSGVLKFLVEKNGLGIMRTIHEELLQCDTKVKLTLVESNTALDKCYMPSLSSDVLASFIVRSMWDSSSVVKVPSLPFYLIMLPVLLLKFLLKSILKIINAASVKRF